MKNQRIIFDNGSGGVSVIVPSESSGLTIEEIAAKDAPTGAEIVDVSAIPSDRTFRDAWVKGGGTVTEDHGKALAIAHEARRRAREAEFAPLDVQATIPAEAAQAEAGRAKIRTKYERLQSDMDAAPDVDSLRSMVRSIVVASKREAR